ncbi:HDOD domain-containing protein [Pseudohongiella sp.]|uniref:HDOD domain-containing protein n=1 Tax=marine sediment metagenome TaxID=412755 RepID=A0A0F9Z4E6_9ZZZZ|nr:HDOD domain-containing protein [Pseudohongiella sp.]HDZ07824.1 HDOD domain-containing protein [Pseudohongiella sp.]HEA62859.1 HDOD domain-containing protein [Pseudohongiella sp.]
MLGKLLDKLFGRAVPQHAPVADRRVASPAPVIPVPVAEREKAPGHDEAARDALKAEIKYSEMTGSGAEQLFYDYLLGVQNTDRISELEHEILLSTNALLDKPESMLDRLPKLPHSVSKLLAMLDTDDFDLPAFCAVVAKDPAIAAQLISVANSAQYNPGGDEITDIKRAFSLLGSQGVKQHVLLGFVKNVSNISHVYFKTFGEKIWIHSDETAHVCRDLARLRGLDADAAFLIGLVHDIGKIVIFKLIVDAFRRSNPDEKLGSSVVKQLLHQKSMQLSVLVATHWRMPDVVIAAIRDLARSERHSTFSPLGEVLINANFISEWRLVLEAGLSSEQAFERAIMRMQLADDVRSYIAAPEQPA